jgi:anti-sigma regulatory factor (Ser/Thr protein kinase)
MRVGPRRGTPAVVVPQRPREREPRLEHGVAFHRDRDHLIGLLVALAQDALERGGTVALAVGPDTERAVREAVRETLGDAEPDRALVALAAPRPVEAGSGQSVALRRARELRELVAVAGPLTVLAEHLPAHDGPDGRFWTELEAAEDIALADLPVHLTCFYPELPLHQSVLDGARRTHPRVLVDGELRANPEHRPPRDVLTGYPPAPPPLLGPPHHRLRFRAWQLREVRRLLREALDESGFDEDRSDDVVLAVNEVASNAVEHGGDGTAELHVWCGSGELTCEVHDPGALTDPLPGLVAPPATDHRGRGLWIARQLCDLLHVWTDDEGTHVRMHCSH